MRTLCRSDVVKRELSWKVKLSIYWSIFVPTLAYGHEIWVVTEEVAKMGFLWRRGEELDHSEWLRVELLLLRIERTLVRTPPFGGFLGASYWEETLGQTHNLLQGLYTPSDLETP